jgi:tripartite-type tricarboxylate transporter receptor subunit TctC
MKLPRRQFLHLAAGVAGLPAFSRIAWAQAYPARPVRIIVGLAAGGGTDIVARLIGQWLSERLGQSFVIENRPGAAGNVATEAVVNASPDGYTLLAVNPGAAINATLYDKLNFNFLRDIAPVAGIIRVPNVMAVNPSLPIKTVPEFLAYAKANPDKINYGSAGTGSSNHLSGELFKMMTGVRMVHVPYRGAAPALTDLIGGQVQAIFSSVTSTVEYIKAEKVRALAVTSTARSEVLPDVPTVADFVPGYEASNWWGIAAPKTTPILPLAGPRNAGSKHVRGCGTTSLGCYGPGPGRRNRSRCGYVASIPTSHSGGCRTKRSIKRSTSRPKVSSAKS